MSNKLKFNPITGKLDLVEHIPELTADPASPRTEDAWVRRSGSGTSIPDGTPIGLLLGLTYTGNSGVSFTYDLSYRTQDGTTVRTPLDDGIEGLEVRIVTGNTTLTTTDELLVCNCTTAGTMTLPQATGIGTVYNIKSIGVGLITIDANGGTIDGSATVPMSQWDSLTFVDYTAGGWVIT